MDKIRTLGGIVLLVAASLLLSACKPREQLEQERIAREQAAVEDNVERFGSRDFEDNKFLPKSQQRAGLKMPDLGGLGIGGFKEGIRGDLKRAKKPLKRHK